MKIVEIVRPFMTTRSNNFRNSTLVEKKVAAALWRLATGNSYKDIGLILGLGTASVQLIIHGTILQRFVRQTRRIYRFSLRFNSHNSRVCQENKNP